MSSPLCHTLDFFSAADRWYILLSLMLILAPFPHHKSFFIILNVSIMSFLQRLKRRVTPKRTEQNLFVRCMH